MVIRKRSWRIKVLVYCLFILTLSSCWHYRLNSENYVRPPEKYRFSYESRVSPLSKDVLIDTSAIYYLHDSNYYRDKKQPKNIDNYLRFYADGRFKMQRVENYPKTKDVNNLEKGIVGYYLIKGKVIKLQIYTDINAGSNQLMFGLIEDDGSLTFLNENPRTYFNLGYSEKNIKKKIKKTSYLNPKHYKKIKLEGMTYDKPRW